MDVMNTSDMYLASVLVAYGGEIDFVDKADKDRQVFVFRTIPSSVWVLGNEYVTRQIVKSISDVKSLMVSGKLMFPPSFVSSIKSIKSYIYTE